MRLRKNNFGNNWRKKQELKGRPYADSIYRTYLNAINIERFEEEDENGEAHPLDANFAIDVELLLESGQKLMGQEKFLSHKFASYNTVTEEYMQDWQEAVVGDWFKLCCQFYFIAYFNEVGDGFCKWVILDMLQLVIATNRGEVVWTEKPNKKDGAKASLVAANVAKLPEDCILYQSGFKPPTENDTDHLLKNIRRQPTRILRIKITKD